MESNTHWISGRIVKDGKQAFQEWTCVSCQRGCTRLMGLNDEAPKENCDREGP